MLQVLHHTAVLRPGQRHGQDRVSAFGGQERYAHLALLQRFRFGACSLGRDRQDPALFHPGQDLAQSGIVRFIAVQPDAIHGPPNRSKEWMVPVFFRNGHDDVFPVNDTDQYGRIQASQVIGCNNEISRRLSFDPMDFNICDDLHDKANDGAQCCVFHRAHFTTSEALVTKTSQDSSRGK